MEAQTGKFDEQDFSIYEADVLANAKPDFRVEILDSQPDNFKVKVLSTEDIQDAASGAVGVANRIAEHMNLALTGFSDPVSVEFSVHPVGDHNARRAMRHPSTEIIRFNHLEKESRPILKIVVVEGKTIEISADKSDALFLNFAKKVVEAGLPFPKRKLSE
ncbi:MAG: hypothetical protein HYV90_04890 [Candidatus Woesebacteria bacterium]|nr:MAG: hypothetical protein HYV90_04890 [Candidatus Woesebacteria bacterium]